MCGYTFEDTDQGRRGYRSGTGYRSELYKYIRPKSAYTRTINSSRDGKASLLVFSVQFEMRDSVAILKWGINS